jgi:hypothetical protein
VSARPSELREREVCRRRSCHRPAQEPGDPVRRGLSAQALRPLEYWITAFAFAGDDIEQDDTEQNSATLRREARCGATIKMRLPVKPPRRDDIRAAPPVG